MKFNFSTILLTAGSVYFLFTAWSLYGVFFPQNCKVDFHCIKPFWTPDDELRLQVSFNDPTTIVVNDTFSLKEGITKAQNMTPPIRVFRNRTVNVHMALFGDSRTLWSGEIEVTMHKEALRTAFNLLKDKNLSVSNPQKSVDLPVNFWLTNLRIYLLEKPVVWDRREIPPEISPHLRVLSRGSSLSYLPLIYVNPKMQKSSDWAEVPTVDLSLQSAMPELEFTVSVEPQSVGRFRLRCTLGMLAEQLRSYGFRSKDIDEMRQLLVDTNFYFLLTTMFVSVFHILFDFLAFKNDISFWRSMRNTTGLSMRTVVWRFISSFIITLHLYEERSSLLVLIPMCISTCIELWKLARIWKFSFSFRHGFRLGTRSKGETETDKLDAEFMFWLQCLMVPLCLAGGVYSLLYTPHRSWYSWCLQTLVHGVYAFGFLFMTPQLFINYRLKSVAHLPWKALTYKAFNTFIDDFFAMIISMPTSHRIACLRDDVIFLIYLYQRWLYPVDKSRVNEYGMRGDQDNEKPSWKSSDHTKAKIEQDDTKSSKKKD